MADMSITLLTKCERACESDISTDISSMEDLLNALEKSCPNIKVLTINDADVSDIEAQIGSTENIKRFSGTMKVHQVTGSIYCSNWLAMKSLSCFCNHFVMGTLDYASISQKPLLHVESVYGLETESNDEPLASLMSQKNMKQLQTFPQFSDASLCGKSSQFEDGPSTSGKKILDNGQFVLVKLLNRKTEYRYVAMCTGVEEYDEVQVVFCKICDETGKNFKINDHDISFITWEQIIEELPPYLIDVYE
ncbi:hypothetical protein FQA39_LY03441 [Lamprigera yunnana]|nr:hypothetical protein FQA39_LY03441 [Lamprigera yunnana]